MPRAEGSDSRAVGRSGSGWVPSSLSDYPTPHAPLHAVAAAIAQQLRGLADEGYDRIAGTFGDNELTVGQVAEFVVIGHTAEHLGSIRATLAG